MKRLLLLLVVMISLSATAQVKNLQFDLVSNVDGSNAKVTHGTAVLDTESQTILIFATREDYLNLIPAITVKYDTFQYDYHRKMGRYLAIFGTTELGDDISFGFYKNKEVGRDFLLMVRGSSSTLFRVSAKNKEYTGK